MSAGFGGLSGGDPGADFRAAQRRHGLGRLAAFGQLIEQPGGYRLDRGLEGIVLGPGGVAQSEDLSNVLPRRGCDLVVGTATTGTELAKSDRH